MWWSQITEKQTMKNITEKKIISQKNRIKIFKKSKLLQS